MTPHTVAVAVPDSHRIPHLTNGLYFPSMYGWQGSVQEMQIFINKK